MADSFSIYKFHKVIYLNDFSSAVKSKTESQLVGITGTLTKKIKSTTDSNRDQLVSHIAISQQQNNITCMQQIVKTRTHDYHTATTQHH